MIEFLVVHPAYTTTADDDSESSGAGSSDSKYERESSGREFWIDDGARPKRIDANKCWLDDWSSKKRVDANETNDEWLADRSGA